MPQKESSRSKSVWWLVSLLGITVGGGILRVLWLDFAPPSLHFDEAVYGLMARMIGRGYWPVFFHAYTGREPLYMYLMAGVFHLLGSSGVTLRLTSALIGIATIPLVYLLGHTLYSRRIGLLAAGITAANYWHLSMSRNGYPNILIPPIESLAVTFLWRGYRERRWREMAIGGAFVGLVLYTYLAARLFPVTLAIFGVYLLLFDRPRVTSRLGLLLLAVACAGLVFAPLGYHFLTNPADFWERANQVLVFESVKGPLASLRIIAQNFLQNILGLVWRGDPRWLFNLPGKPALTPPLTLFFLIGLGVALKHWRQPEYALLPIWLCGMILPAAFTFDAMPQSQRMSGIIPALFTLVALGLDRTIALLREYISAPWRAIPAVLATLLLLFEGVFAGSTYFDVWAREPLNYYRFHGPYEALARHAEAHLKAGDTVVVLSEHYKHPTSLFTAPIMHQAIWVVTGRTVVIPHRSEGEILFYWPQDPYYPQPFVERLLLPLVEPVAMILDPYGNPAVKVYRLAAAPSAATAEAVASLGEIDILGWDAPTAQRRDEPLPVAVRWRVHAETTQGRFFSIHLVDEQGHQWSQCTELGFMPEQWHAGDLVYQQIEVPLPPGIPPGDYSLRLLLADAQQTLFPVIKQGQTAGVYLNLGSVTLLPEGGLVAPLEQGIAFGEQVQLLRWSLPSSPLATPQLALEATWQALEAPSTDYVATFTLEDSRGTEVYSDTKPLASQYPTSQWVKGEVVMARYVLDLPDLPAGTYRLKVRLPGLEGTATLGDIETMGSLRRFAPPPMAFEVRAQVGDDALLLGYDAEPLTPKVGETWTLTLYWKALRPPQRNAKVFVHLVDQQGHIVTQDDSVPAGWQRPTTTWQRDEVIVDAHTLSLSGVAAGEYTVYLGMYDEETFARWPVKDAAGQMVPDGRLPLATLTISP